MSYSINRETYNRHTVTNDETGASVTQWDRVTVGQSKNVWDVDEVLFDGEVRLHRQVAGKVTYRRVPLDRLTVVEKRDAEVEVAEEALPTAEVTEAPAFIARQVRVVKAYHDAAGVMKFATYRIGGWEVSAATVEEALDMANRHEAAVRSAERGMVEVVNPAARSYGKRGVVATPPTEDDRRAAIRLQDGETVWVLEGDYKLVSELPPR